MSPSPGSLLRDLTNDDNSDRKQQENESSTNIASNASVASPTSQPFLVNQNNNLDESRSINPFLAWFRRGTNYPKFLSDHSESYISYEDTFKNIRGPSLHTQENLMKEEHRAATIAACFLKDYEDGRPPTLSNDADQISSRLLEIHRFKHSWAWKMFGVTTATVLLFMGCTQNRFGTISLQTISVALFGVDWWMKNQLWDWSSKNKSGNGRQRTRRAERQLMTTTLVFLSVFFLHSWLAFFFLDAGSTHSSTLIISMFKPLVFFNESKHARDAVEALCRIGKKLLRVILVELFLILTFAAIACRLYRNDESFQNLGRAWVSLFTLSTTVVNPGLWMPAYSNSRWNAIFFVIFIVVSVFYLHSLVLSVVFQVFIQSATEVHQRSVIDKEQSLRLAYLALITTNRHDNDDVQIQEVVNPQLLRETLHMLRPHYSRLKIKILMDILIPAYAENSKQRGKDDLWIEADKDSYALDYEHFRIRMRRVLTSSVRVSRSQNNLGFAVEILSMVTAILNFIWVTLLTSNFQATWFVNSEFVIGSAIALLALLEALLRYNPIRFAYRLVPMSRLNAILDGLGATGALISLLGIVLFAVGDENGMEFLLTGRAVGMIQSMRFSVWFREVLQRSLYVLPLLSGPIFLVLTSLHVFVCIGMLLWGGAVDLDKMSMNENVEPLFYLNNFNSYHEGCIAVFNVLVVNDWHHIAKSVFLYASRHSNYYIVYSYFVVVVIVAVSIMLNVIVAFFVETFATQLNLVEKEDEVHVGNRNLLSLDANDLSERDFIATNCSSTGEMLQFDIIKREGYDEIMETVANQSSNQNELFAKSLRDIMESWASISPTTRDSIGHLVCCRQSMRFFGTENFRRIVKDYLRRDELHMLVMKLNDSEPMSVPASLGTCKVEQRCFQKQITHPNNSSQMLLVTGTIMKHNRQLAILTAEVTTVCDILNQ